MKPYDVATISMYGDQKWQVAILDATRLQHPPTLRCVPAGTPRTAFPP